MAQNIICGIDRSLTSLNGSVITIWSPLTIFRCFCIFSDFSHILWFLTSSLISHCSDETYSLAKFFPHMKGRLRTRHRTGTAEPCSISCWSPLSVYTVICCQCFWLAKDNWEPGGEGFCWRGPFCQPLEHRAGRVGMETMLEVNGPYPGNRNGPNQCLCFDKTEFLSVPN